MEKAKTASSSSYKKMYTLKYEDNNSKRWDGQRILVDGEWLASMYEASELAEGQHIKLPWKGKGGKITDWNVVVVNDNDESSTPPVLKSSIKPMKKVKNKTRLPPTTSNKGKKDSQKKGSILSVGSREMSDKSSSSDYKSPGVTAVVNATVLDQIVGQQGQIITLLTKLVEQQAVTSRNQKQVVQLTDQTSSVASASQLLPSFSTPQPSKSLFVSPTPNEFPSMSIDQTLIQPKFSNAPYSNQPTPFTSLPSMGFSESFNVLESSSSPLPQPTTFSTNIARLATSPNQVLHTSQQTTPQQNQQLSNLSTQNQPVQAAVIQAAVIQADTETNFDEMLEEAYQCLSSGEEHIFPNDTSSGNYPSSPSGVSLMPMEASATEVGIPQPQFKTAPKLQPVEKVMREYPGTDVASLKRLAVSLAKYSIFGIYEMSTKSLSGRRNTKLLEFEKLDYIKTIIKSRVPEKSQVEFEFIWKECRTLICKSCQTLRSKNKKQY